MVSARTASRMVIGAALVAAFSVCGSARSTDALDEAFRFASAIESDAKDRSAAEERVVLEYATLGDLDSAMRLADRIEGWERGVAYAEIGALLVEARRLDDATAMIRKAEEYRGTIEGWQNPRIGAHVANALAALGAVDPSREIVRNLAAADRQYQGRARATVASAYASAGNFEKAMAELSSPEKDAGPEDAVWRTDGYLDIARQKRFQRTRRLEALDVARRSAEGIEGWIRAEPLVAVAGEYRAIGRIETARGLLEQAESVARAIPRTAPLAAPILAEVAREWARVGSRQRARTILSGAEEIARASGDVGRPFILANVAGGYQVLDDGAAARRVLALAFQEARAQVNARPRALAVVEICRTMARFEIPLDDATRSTLADLLSGLKDPW